MGNPEEQRVRGAESGRLKAFGNDRRDATTNDDFGLPVIGEIGSPHIGHRFGVLEAGWRNRPARRIEIAGAQQVVLKVTADFRHIDQAVDARGVEHILRADAGAHQQSRSLQRTRAQDHLISEDFHQALRPDDLEAAHLIAIQVSRRTRDPVRMVRFSRPRTPGVSQASATVTRRPSRIFSEFGVTPIIFPLLCPARRGRPSDAPASMKARATGLTSWDGM